MPRTRLRHAVHPRAITADQEEPVAPPEPRVEGRDWLGVVGLAVLVAGVWQIYSPAAWIVLGVALLLIAWRV